MKKNYFLLIISLIASNAQAQTTLKYSGNATTSYFGLFPYKIAGIAEMDVSNNADRIDTHVGLLGQATNSTGSNIGIYGTTKQNSFGNAYSYVGIYGNNLSNAINQANASVYGGAFSARNYGANAYTIGVEASAVGGNNTSTVIGLDATAYNLINITAEKTIAVRGVTTSGQSTLTSFKDVANPGGYFRSNDGQGIYGTTISGYNVPNFGNVSVGVTGYSNIADASSNIGVYGHVEGSGKYKYGVFGYLQGTAPTDNAAGVCGQDIIGSSNTYAGLFLGKVRIDGILNATGTKNFMIDHPLDPENKILRHAAIESNEVLNQYSGNVTTDASGYATVTLPNYFETLNKDFRYQLTVIGSFSQAIIKQEVTNNQFVIQTNTPSVKVSWQVTGVRNDKMMQYAPFVAESEKTGQEKGKYLSPEAYGKPQTSGQFAPIPVNKNPPTQD